MSVNRNPVFSDPERPAHPADSLAAGPPGPTAGTTAPKKKKPAARPASKGTAQTNVELPTELLEELQVAIFKVQASRKTRVTRVTAFSEALRMWIDKHT